MANGKYPYNYDFQLGVVSLMALDPGFRNQYEDLVSPRFFDDDVLQCLVRLIGRMSKKKVSITQDSIETELEDYCRHNKIKDKFKNRALDTIDDACSADIEYLDYIPEKVAIFARSQASATAIVRSGQVLQQGKDPELIRNIIDKALMVGTSRDIGLDFKEASSDVGLLKKMRQKQQKAKVPTGLEGLDNTMRGGLSIGELGMVIGPTGRGKCFSKGTRVLMYNGDSKAVEDVRVGDLLMGDDSTPRKVLGTTSGHGALYRVDQINGISYTVNGNHVLSLYRTRASRNSKKPSEAAAFVDVPVSDYLGGSKWFKHRHRGYKARANFPNRGKPPFSPYYMGLWLGDGISLNMSIDVNDNDTELLDFLGEFCVDNKLLLEVKKTVPGKGSSLCRITSNWKPHPIRDFMKAEGLRETKKVPDVFKFSSEEDRLELLAGFIDADGHKHYNGYDIVHRDLPVIHDIAFIARSLGFRVSVSHCVKSCQGGFVGDYLRVSIFGDTDRIPVKLPYKKCHPKAKRNPLVYGIKVTPVGDGDYYGFEVDGNHRFLLEDFTVTHNSIVLVNFAAQALIHGKNVVYVSFELKTEEVLMRMMQSLTASTVEEVEEEDPTFRKKMDRFNNRCNNNLQIKFYNPGELSAIQLRSYLSRLQATKGWKPDLIILDDADSMRIPKSSGGDGIAMATYQALGTLYTDILCIINDFECCCWCACQATRNAFDAEVVDLSHTADSFKKAHKSHIGLCVCQTGPEAEREEGRLFIAKARNYKSGFFIPIKFNKERMIVEYKPKPKKRGGGEGGNKKDIIKDGLRRRRRNKNKNKKTKKVEGIGGKTREELLGQKSKKLKEAADA